MAIMIILPNENLTYDNLKVTYKANDEVVFSFDIWTLTKLSVFTTTSYGSGLALFFEKHVLVLPTKHPDYDTLYIGLTTNYKIDYKKYLQSSDYLAEHEFVLWKA